MKLPTGLATLVIVTLIATFASAQQPTERRRLGIFGGLAGAAMDVSDGLLQDAGHIAKHSACRLVIDAPSIPLSDAAKELIAEQPGLFGTAIEGGDDYELLFSAPSDSAADVRTAADEAGVSVTRIGRVESGAGVQVLDKNDEVIDGLSTQGWRHF